MESNINRENEFFEDIKSILKSFYSTVNRSIDISAEACRNRATVMPGRIKSSFENYFSSFYSQVGRMAESVVEQSRNGSSMPPTIDFSTLIDEVLNNTFNDAKRFLEFGNFGEAASYDIIKNGVGLIEEKLISKMNNDYRAAIDKFTIKNKENVFQLPPEEMKSYKEKEKIVYNKPKEPEKSNEKEEKKWEPLPDEPII